ncbi:MAG: hypothetical protein AB2807_02280 [Candidatus Sedimenticola endophacoides]
MLSSAPYRVILFHKQPTSARTRFLRLSNNSVCTPETLPTLARVVEAKIGSTVLQHPASVITDLEDAYGFETGSLKPEGDFFQLVEVPGGSIQIILMEVTTIDPPFEIAERCGGRFVDLTEARDLPVVELELLRAAYETVLGG